jgi:hypothetical protein
MIGIIDCRPRKNEQNWTSTNTEWLEFLDRPLLQHAIEQMVQMGVKHCVVISEDPAVTLERCGAGERWGCALSAIPASGVDGFLSLLSADSVFIGRADCIPRLRQHDAFAHAPVQLVFHRTKQKAMFTGWGRVSREVLQERQFSTGGADSLVKAHGKDLGWLLEFVSVCIRTDSPEMFLQSQQLVLEGLFPELIFYANEVQPGVWAARGAVIHPSAQIEGKVFVGAFARVSHNVKIAGHVVLGHNTAVGSHASLTDVAVQPGTYIGRKATVRHSVVFANAAASSAHPAPIRVSDPRLLTRTDMSLRQFGKLMWSCLWSGASPAAPQPVMVRNGQ